MVRIRNVLFIIVVSFLLLGGTHLLLQPDDLRDGPQPRQGVVRVSTEDVSENNGMVTYNLSVVAYSNLKKDVKFSDVRVVFYDENRSKISSEKIGLINLSNRSTYHINTQLPVYAEYITVESPELLGADRVSIIGLYQQDDGTYREYGVTNESKFPD